jgi:hypothetical protein
VIKMPQAASLPPRYGDLNGSALAAIPVAAMPA